MRVLPLLPLLLSLLLLPLLPFIDDGVVMAVVDVTTMRRWRCVHAVLFACARV